MRALRQAVLFVAAAFALGGCAELLPKAHTEVASPWRSFGEARSAVERIEAQRATVADLRAQGIDPFVSPNVQLLTYSDIVLRFPMNWNGTHARVDRGLRECLEAGKACTGYSIAAKDIRRERVGSYWRDAFGFKRVVDTSGWSFNALILLVGERVVYTLYGGQPNVREQETVRRPLGPLQQWGDVLPVQDLVR